jgi:GTPase SAR1 family protein
MKQIRLVTGVPGAGKTTLMRQLTEHSFVGLSVDEAYLHFIRDHCQPIDFPALRYYIAHHYDVILSDRLRSKAYLGRDFFAEWVSHLLTRIVGFSALHPKIVVQGYSLKHVAEDDVRMQSGANVATVRVESGRYFAADREVTIEQIARVERVASIRWDG